MRMDALDVEADELLAVAAVDVIFADVVITLDALTLELITVALLVGADVAVTPSVVT